MKYYTLAFLLTITACTCKKEDKDHQSYVRVQDSLSQVIVALEGDKTELESQIDEVETRIQRLKTKIQKPKEVIVYEKAKIDSLVRTMDDSTKREFLARELSGN